MSRLSQNKIYQMIVEHNEGDTRSVIAKRHEVDSSTVRYHIEKFEATYGSTAAVYSLIKVKPKACEHPSMKCFICGHLQDAIRRRELQKVHDLTIALMEANALIERLGYEPVKPGEPLKSGTL